MTVLRALIGRARRAWPILGLTAALLVVVAAWTLWERHSCDVDVVDRHERPNVVLVVVDDLDVALYESLPRLPDMALEGVRYSNAYVTTPICCPSRVSILVGQYADTHGVVSNQPPAGGHGAARALGVEDCTLATWLDDAGYHTGMIGKYLVGYGRRDGVITVPAGWDQWEARAGGEYQNVTISLNGERRTLRGYETDRYADRAVRFMRRSPEPYFLHLAPYAPHEPSIPAKRHADAGDRRYATMLAVEDMMARLREADPTAIIIFTSDNGYHLEPTPAKGLPQESDLRVPLFILGMGPGVDERYALNIDIAPTVADLAGVQPPPFFVEGKSLLDTSWDRSTFRIGMWSPDGSWIWRGEWGDHRDVEWAASPGE